MRLAPFTRLALLAAMLPFGAASAQPARNERASRERRPTAKELAAVDTLRQALLRAVYRGDTLSLRAFTTDEQPRHAIALVERWTDIGGGGRPLPADSLPPPCVRSDTLWRAYALRRGQLLARHAPYAVYAFRRVARQWRVAVVTAPLERGARLPCLSKRDDG
jgi:hypothetical protein